MGGSGLEQLRRPRLSPECVWSSGKTKPFSVILRIALPSPAPIFSLNYESNGLGNSLYSVPDCLIPNKSFHVAPQVVAIRTHYRLIRALILGIT